MQGCLSDPSIESGVEHHLTIYLSLVAKSLGKWDSTRENLSSGFGSDKGLRPACASAQTDQRLCYSLFGKYHI